MQYYVPLYIIPNSLFIEIYDKKNKCFRQLPASNCEVEVKKSTMTSEEELENTKFYLDKYKEYDKIEHIKEYDKIEHIKEYDEIEHIKKGDKIKHIKKGDNYDY